MKHEKRKAFDNIHQLEKLMTTRILFSILFIATLSSCEKGNWPNCIKASDEIVEETRSLEPFTTIEFNMSGDLEITRDTSLSGDEIILETSENIIDAIRTDVKDKVLTISDRRCLKNLKTLKFRVSAADIRTIVINGSGNVSSIGSFTTDELTIKVNGSGNTKMSVDAAAILIDINGSGNVDLSGTCDEFVSEVNGSGNTSAFDLVTGPCTITVNGSGNSELTVNGDLNVNIEGSGNVVYDGNPTSIQVNTSGSGSVRAR